MKTLDEHLHEFKTDGYTIFPKILDDKWVQEMRDAYHQIAERLSTPDGKKATSLPYPAEMIEYAPKLTLPAITIPRILDFAEMLVGPYVQLESIAYQCSPPISKKEAARRIEEDGWGYHRDMFAFFPEDGVYHRPLLFNAVVYLQDLTDDIGPLHVVPGSHMQAMSLPTRPKSLLPENKVVYPKAGDIVMFHCSMLHSGTPNTSDEDRYIFIVTYNHSWLKYRANYNGPNSQAIIRQARERNDRRTLRLFGVDDLLFSRANSGFRLPDEERWKEWVAEDKEALATS